jgi:hypothetical protein
MDNALAAPPLVLGRLGKLELIRAERNPFLEYGEYAGIYAYHEVEDNWKLAVADFVSSDELKKLLQDEMLVAAGFSGDQRY